MVGKESLASLENARGGKRGNQRVGNFRITLETRKKKWHVGGQGLRREGE